MAQEAKAEAPTLTHRDVGNAKGLQGAILAMRRPCGPDPVAVSVLGCVGGCWCYILLSCVIPNIRGDDDFHFPLPNGERARVRGRAF